MKYFISLYISYIILVGIFSFSVGPITGYTDINGNSGIAIKNNSYKEGDILTYYILVANKADMQSEKIGNIGGNVYITEKNNLVKPRLVIGKSLLSIPFLGYIIRPIRNPIWLFILIYLPAIIIIYRLIYLIIKETKK